MKGFFSAAGRMLLFLTLIFGPTSLHAQEAEETEAETPRTLLMDESLIVGMELGAIGRQKRIPGPALSTALRWDGVAAEALDIPKEILKHLSQSDLSFFKNREIADDLSDDMHADHDD